MSVNRTDLRALCDAIAVLAECWRGKAPSSTVDAAVNEAERLCKRVRSQFDALGRSERGGA